MATSTELGHWLLSLDASTVGEARDDVRGLLLRATDAHADLHGLKLRIGSLPDGDLIAKVDQAASLIDDVVTELLSVQSRLDG
jgi:hypothetical protein